IPGRSINSARALKIQEVTKAAFMHRRKMIGKSLKRLLSIEELQNLGIDPKARPENISVEDYSTIAETLI
ncbi:MAG: 16S rRNA (adenine(1518)-N(6)/adenine(1519)-N(6))-dimethyltransferase, partial [Gammaproteobacteria bacterium]|nr:16S rRNA (adenine(1518)-N(6)/adenine(1519)-N(6))-dimethyltransferase [Gammaproteobacteria bacterium]